MHTLKLGPEFHISAEIAPQIIEAHKSGDRLRVEQLRSRFRRELRAAAMFSGGLTDREIDDVASTCERIAMAKDSDAVVILPIANGNGVAFSASLHAFLHSLSSLQNESSASRRVASRRVAVNDLIDLLNAIDSESK